LDPTTLEIRIRRAKAFAKKGFITRAIQELQQLKTENPHFVAARIQLGLLHYSQNNILDAELEWEQVLEIDPVHNEAKTYLEMARKVRTTPEDSSR
jgi:Tfp pilus assembly protein PilF